MMYTLRNILTNTIISIASAGLLLGISLGAKAATQQNSSASIEKLANTQYAWSNNRYYNNRNYYRYRYNPYQYGYRHHKVGYYNYYYPRYYRSRYYNKTYYQPRYNRRPGYYYRQPGVTIRLGY